MRLLALALVAAALQPPASVQRPPSTSTPDKIDARIYRVTAVASGVSFDNPAIRLKGVIAPTAGHRLQIVEIVLGRTPIYSEVAAFRLVANIRGAGAPGVSDVEFAAIAVGGQPDTLFPLARLPLEREVGQVLPTDAILALTRHGDVAVTIEAGPLATLAFLYDIPLDATVKSLRLPDGTILPLK